MTDDRLVVRFKFSDTEREFSLDLLNLKAKERVALEEFFDEPWADLWSGGWLLRSTKGAVFLAYLARRRTEPQFTYAQALEFEGETIDDEDLSGLTRSQLDERAAEPRHQPAGQAQGQGRGDQGDRGQATPYRDPAEDWHPVLARVYGLRPEHMGELTDAHWADIHKDIKGLLSNV